MAPAIRKPRHSYHHGDLKEALVEAAAAIVRTNGVSALTLREVAGRTGVSPAAPYRHFPDRRALIAAVAERGFERLGQAMMAGMQSAGGRAGFKQVAIAYVRFGLDNPAEYRVMFGPELADSSDFPSLQQTGRAVLGGVAGAVSGLQAAGLVGPGDPSLIAAALWSTLHGLVMLVLDGQTEHIAPDPDVLVEEATRIVMFGIAPR
jgi:AcrR family transcriptional regulator